MGVFDTVVLTAQYAVLLLIPYLILLGGYRVLAHPLRHYPGPPLARLSDVYGAFYAWNRNLYLRTYADHLNYGPVIRQGPNKLVFNSVAAVHDIYANDRVSKSLSYVAYTVNPGKTNVINTVNKPVHRVKRKLVGAVVTERSMRTFEPTMTEQIDIFIKLLLPSPQGSSNNVVNMSTRCRHLGMDIAGYLGFGYALKLQTDNENRFLLPGMNGGLWRLNIYMQYPSLRKLGYEIVEIALTFIKGKGFLSTLTKMIQARLAQDKDAHHDLYAFMADALDAPDGDKISLSEIWTEGISFLPAAGDTTSATLSALFFYLSRNAHCRRRLADEIRSTFASSDEIRGGAQLTSCRYLRACIDEALRMSPPVPGTLWRQQLPQDGDAPWVVDGHVIPPGTQVGVSHYALHHNEEYFPDPFSFKPERWLPADEVSKEPSAANRAAFVAFSLGARGCAGKAMAYLEVGLVSAKTLWYFDFEPASEYGALGRDTNEMGEFLLHDVFTSSHDGPYLTFTPRGDLWKELAGQGQ
ncbi:Uu.00g012230.m01.CDS01 [Anthostomella pinea]|uniref:Uu.00g012230.m01.CDS01 n=1 Tax=Anthostomella pinea TaxID=933095 RepID=A0AAI8VXW1_9PEZI|nr:Uu.00g012230.m01.CDS01 [Anthostomella pinea]